MRKTLDPFFALLITHDVAMDTTQALNNCSNCPKLCHFRCPVSDVVHEESTQPWGKMRAMKLASAKAIPFDKETAKLAYACTQCAACSQYCDFSNPVPETLNEFRTLGFSRGVAPDEVYNFVDQFKTTNAPFSQDLDQQSRTR